MSRAAVHAMRCGRGLAVSSALLFLSIASVPCHPCDSIQSASSSASDPAPGLLISEFSPCGLNGDDDIVLANTAPVGIDLRGWSLSDGEGVWKVTDDVWIQSGRTISISCNSTSFISAFDRTPEVALDELDRPVSVVGTFRLADDGDWVSLASPAHETSDFV